MIEHISVHHSGGNQKWVTVTWSVTGIETSRSIRVSENAKPGEIAQAVRNARADCKDDFAGIKKANQVRDDD